MTIIEALKMNKPFRRKNDKDYINANFNTLGGLTKADILATDWEVEGHTERYRADPTGREL